MKRYNPKEIEPKWQKVWADTRLYEVDDNSDKPRYYYLIEFPYPSGDGLHVGHLRPYVAFDVMSRIKRAQGHEVLYPFGFDAFGLPTENYAVKTGIHPAKVTKDNTDTFRQQVQRIGISFDWSRELITTDPKYYKWTQWIFLQLFKHGLAYQDETMVWWCEELKTVLANEEVIDGKSERGGFPCERVPLRQWMLAITKYADRLDKDLDDVDYLPRVTAQQRNWIGKSIGVEIEFKLAADESEAITVYTTRPDTIFGATFMVLAPEHPLVAKITTDDQKKAVEEYVAQAAQKSDLDRQAEEKQKTGVFSGAYAVNPASGEKIPVWVSDFVLMSYGTGAIMAVPANDTRDGEFAEQFDLPVVEIIKDQDKHEPRVMGIEGEVINSGKYNGMRSATAREQIAADLVKQKAAREQVNYKLRDWVFSRQRYWGEPFPIVWVSEEAYKQAGGDVKEWLSEQAVTRKRDGRKEYALPVPPNQLPVELPDVIEFVPKGLGEGPLATAAEWVDIWANVKTGETVSRSKDKPAGDSWFEGRRETDTMPNWAGSSWYFLRYIDPHNDQALADPEKLKQWTPVNWYNGGMEHTTLHLLYSRFWHKFLHDIDIVPTSEPYAKRTSHDMILGEGGVKMSKSLGNVINPNEIADSYGADTLRVYEMFMGPFDQAIAWSVETMAGSRRFLERVWNFVQEFIETGEGSTTDGDNTELETALVAAAQRTIKKVSEDIERLGFNTAVASLMELTNGLYKIRDDLPFEASDQWKEVVELTLRLLAPFAPHMCEELWEELGHERSIHTEPWPLWDENLIKEDLVTVVVQINGKVRGTLEMATGTPQTEIEAAAKEDPIIKKHLAGDKVLKVIFVPDKLVNFVV